MCEPLLLVVAFNCDKKQNKANNSNTHTPTHIHCAVIMLRKVKSSQKNKNKPPTRARDRQPFPFPNTARLRSHPKVRQRKHVKKGSARKRGERRAWEQTEGGGKGHGAVGSVGVRGLCTPAAAKQNPDPNDRPTKTHHTQPAF